MYYTSEHEWIDYRGYTALVGICKNKLSAIKDVERAIFCDALRHVDRGTVIATFYDERKSIEVCMPVDGKILGFNHKLIENPSMILGGGMESIWIAKISPNAPYQREGLLQGYQYNLVKKKVRG